MKKFFNRTDLINSNETFTTLQLAAHEIPDAKYTFVVFGASGDLAKKKIYPTLWALYKENLLPPDTSFIGYARSNLTVDDIKSKCAQYLKVCPHVN